MAGQKPKRIHESECVRAVFRSKVGLDTKYMTQYKTTSRSEWASICYVTAQHEIYVWNVPQIDACVRPIPNSIT